MKKIINKIKKYFEKRYMEKLKKDLIKEDPFIYK
jgi:hypothetical protein